MSNSQTALDLIRRAMQTGDPAPMRQAFELLLGSGAESLSPADEYEIRHEDYVMEMPQSGERIRGREAMRRMQENFPNPPSGTIRRVVGADRTWVLEGVNDYGDEVWRMIAVFELAEDGRILLDTRYYTQPFEAPAWRAPFVEPM
jgi:hypothetical protein